MKTNTLAPREGEQPKVELSYKDKNGKHIGLGMDVDVPESNGTDMWNFDFRGVVDSFRDGDVIVLDGDGDYFSIEPGRLEIAD